MLAVSQCIVEPEMWSVHGRIYYHPRLPIPHGLYSTEDTTQKDNNYIKLHSGGLGITGTKHPTVKFPLCYI